MFQWGWVCAVKCTIDCAPIHTESETNPNNNLLMRRADLSIFPCFVWLLPRYSVEIRLTALPTWTYTDLQLFHRICLCYNFWPFKFNCNNYKYLWLMELIQHNFPLMYFPKFRLMCRICWPFLLMAFRCSLVTFFMSNLYHSILPYLRRPPLCAFQ